MIETIKFYRFTELIVYLTQRLITVENIEIFRQKYLKLMQTSPLSTTDTLSTMASLLTLPPLSHTPYSQNWVISLRFYQGYMNPIDNSDNNDHAAIMVTVAPSGLNCDLSKIVSLLSSLKWRQWHPFSIGNGGMGANLSPLTIDQCSTMVIHLQYFSSSLSLSIQQWRSLKNILILQLIFIVFDR